MSPRLCFNGKIAAGLVSNRAGRKLLDLLTEFEEQHKGTLGDAAAERVGALDAAEVAAAEAAHVADVTRGNIIAQAGALKAAAAYEARIAELRKTPGDFGFGSKAPPPLAGESKSTLLASMRALLMRDPWEIATDHNNVFYLARNLRGEAHRLFADAIEYLRPKALGFKEEATREIDVLRALYGRSDVAQEARAVAEAWSRKGGVADYLRQEFVGAGGLLPERKTWRLPNPTLDDAKVLAFGRDRAKQFWRGHVERADMLDFSTGKPLTDARFEQLLDEAYSGFESGWQEGAPSAALRGRRMLANSRDFARFFAWKDAESWMQVAEAMGAHASVFDTMMSHIRGMAEDTAMMRIMGPNPEATKRFILNLFDREATRLHVNAENADAATLRTAATANKKIAGQVARARKQFEDVWAEVSGANAVPVNTGVANALGDMRAWLAASQLGQAIIASFSDVGTLAMTARLNDLPATAVLSRAVKMAAEKGSEIQAAQMGVVADSLAHQAGGADRIMGETIRTGIAGKMAQGVIRASGLRRWTAILRGAFGLEMMAKLARERHLPFSDLDPKFRDSLARYGIGADEWASLKGAQDYEPRPGAPFLRPADVAAMGDKALSEKLSRLINTEMDYAVIEHDPLARAILIGDTRPGTIKGEAWRAIGLYKSFPLTFLTMHAARAMARGWDGSRLGHAAGTFIAMSLFGALAMQVKEVNAGRDPLSLDPSTGKGLQAWGKAVLQGGGFGVFGDMLFVDKTKYGNSWAATILGPQFAAAESIAGDFVMKNIQLAAKGQQTHFLGDALYIGERYIPGGTLAPLKLAFQRKVLEQAALWVDDRARERFAHIETQARQQWGQGYWWGPGRSEPRRPADLGAMLGR